MPTNLIRPGSVVRLKCGGDKMVVSEFTPNIAGSTTLDYLNDNGKVICWYWRDGKVESVTLWCKVLELAEDSISK